MATNNRGGNRSRSRNNNPEGRNQYSGWTETAKDRPFATAAASAGPAVDRQRLSDQISEWREGMSSSSGDESASGDSFMASSGSSSGARRGGRRTQTEIAEEALTLKETGKASA